MIKKIAIVGSRRMSEYGKEVIRKLLIKNYELRDKGFEVVTIKVFGCNSEVVKLSQKFNLKIKIYEGDNFEKLNEQVANYADCLVIVEGGERSGTLLLAQNFVEKGKRILVVPGRILDEGSFAPNWLAMQGAEMILDINDLTEVLQ